jgi:hypothetical protein
MQGPPLFPVSPVQEFNSTALFAAWEKGASQPALMRALTLLAMAWPEKSEEEWGRISIGERDARLLRLRQELFGPKLEATTVCSKCGERIELTFSTHDVLAPPPLPVPKKGLRVEVAGYQVTHRLPTSADLLEITKAGAANGRTELLKRCVQAARFGRTEVEPEKLPEEVINSVAEKMAKADPQAEVQIALSCPVCMHQWSMPFDILSYLWSEIEDFVQRLLLEIHALASAYGWSEGEIVEMSPRRRRLYLDMVGS